MPRQFNTYIIDFQENWSSRWTTVGKFKAYTPAGAISQFMQSAKSFPNLTAVRATQC